ncbi:MAG: peptidylprolyl isomerase [Anaerolineae bacterium]|nr:peptidylprolyl isomerase [Gemmatimonadaceae bacterium]
MKKLLTALVMAASSAAAGAQDTTAVAGSVPIDRIVAVVGKEPLLWSHVLEAMNRRANGQPLPTDSAEFRLQAQQILTQLVNEELLVQKAVEEKVEVSEADISATVEKQLNRIQAQYKTDEEFREDLSRSGFGTPEEYRKWFSDQQRRSALQERYIAKLRQEQKLPAAPVTDADIAKYFEENRAQMPRRPSTVSFRQVIITVQPSPAARRAALAKADSLIAELRAGGDFEKIAKRESMDPNSKDIGGDLGWLRRGNLVPEFERMMVVLPPGRVSPPVETTYGIHIMRVDRVQLAEFKVRQILLRPAIDSTDVARARAQADSVVMRWRAGASFDTLVARYHDPGEDKNIPTAFPRAQLPPPYVTAFEGKNVNDITDPFPIDDKARDVPKFVVAQLTAVGEEREPTLVDWKEQLREQLAQERAYLRLLARLREQTYVSVRL